MTLYTCKCLNVRLHVTGDVPLLGARVADIEQRDRFFRESLVSVLSAELTQDVAQQALVSLRRAGAWSVHVCVACDTHTHATGPYTHTLLNKLTQTTPEAVEALKSSPHFSPVFKLLVPEISSEYESKENADSNKVPSLVPAVPALSKQLSTSLQSQLESIEESIRLFRDLKYAEYEEFRERANRDHQILASIVTKARQADGLRGPPPSPPTPLELRRRLSSFRGVKKLKQNTVKNTRNIGSEEDSLDAEDIFDLEGDVQSRDGNNSDADDYDSEDSGSNDEGIHIRCPGPGRAPPVDTVARSLPVNVPKFSHIPMSRHHQDDEDEPQDIAASIKALARSVHADVFGDLPRPRFSTQI